jgi:hypothetical protein
MYFGELGMPGSGVYPERMATAESSTAQVQPVRRWKRHNFDLAVFLRVLRPEGLKTIQACGRQLNEGGMAVFAGAELEVGEKIEIEFTPPYADTPIKLKAVIRNRNEYYYGLEFIAGSAAEQREIDLLRLLVQALTGFVPETGKNIE